MSGVCRMEQTIITLIGKYKSYCTPYPRGRDLDKGPLLAFQLACQNLANLIESLGIKGLAEILPNIHVCYVLHCFLKMKECGKSHL